MIADFLTALSLLTIVPVPARWCDGARPPGKSLAWYPLVGLLLGIVLALAMVSMRLLLGDLVAAALVVALWAFLTGGLHLEGLADAGDGLAATAAREKRLEIMHDPRVGAFGATTLIVVLLVKFAALASLRGALVLLLAPALARWAIVCAAAFPLARPQGMAAMFRQGFGRAELTIATLWAALVAAVFGWVGLAAIVAAGIGVLVLARLAVQRLGGLNGDIYGAICEVTEVVVLLAGTVWANG